MANSYDQTKGGPTIQQANGRHFSGILLRYIASFLFGVVSASFFLGGKSRDISDLVNWRGGIDKTLERMDNDGTRASRWRIEEEAKDMGRIDARLKVTEETAKQLETLKLKVESQGKAIDELKAPKR